MKFTVLALLIAAVAATQLAGSTDSTDNTDSIDNTDNTNNTNNTNSAAPSDSSEKMILGGDTKCGDQDLSAIKMKFLTLLPLLILGVTASEQTVLGGDVKSRHTVAISQAIADSPFPLQAASELRLMLNITGVECNWEAW
ncbi:hypothetical protein BO71DRAFT_434687 [Aspergillus ellipticus CBS 707.79]|uniref:Uncharacterized protein n=1 Tax=Aspergillus ellipticus CBS 707.79 TaxID=1448320 RepID=A0A319DN68_9EURO|nr:hypothetical protein BO71DRAFT_434687 [Aspergillus ellipticus CBS 707.79]